MDNQFSFPSVDHLVEGVHYTIVDWDFAQNAPAQPAQPSGEGCPEGEKMVFGVCRKVGGSGEKDFDSSKKTKQEEEVEAEGAKQKSDVKSNKAFTKGGKRYGWAMKNGKPVVVEWGSVAGEKKVGPAKPKSGGGGGSRAGGSGGGSNAARIRGLQKALQNPDLNDAARAAIQKQIDELG